MNGRSTNTLDPEIQSVPLSSLVAFLPLLSAVCFPNLIPSAEAEKQAFIQPPEYQENASWGVGGRSRYRGSCQESMPPCSADFPGLSSPLPGMSELRVRRGSLQRLLPELPPRPVSRRYGRWQ